MTTFTESRERFAEIVDALTDTVLAVQSSNLDTEMLTRTAAKESQNIAELGLELRAMRSPLPSGLMVCAHDFEALARFADVNGLGLDEIEYGVEVDSGKGRVITLRCEMMQISDISGLSHLTSLNRLFLDGTLIEDISALSGLTALTYLSLRGNDIQDLSPLTCLSSLRTLWCNEPRHSECASAIKNYYAQIALLRDRGVNVN